MTNRYEVLETYITPPVINGSSLSPVDPRGCRASSVTSTVTHVRIDNDVLLQPPDPTGGSSGIAMIGDNMIRIAADGDDLCVIFDAAGTATPDPAAVGTAAGACEIIWKGTYQDFLVNAKSHAYINVRSRANAATMRYRLSAPLSSQK